jgi:hypothetical protein
MTEAIAEEIEVLRVGAVEPPAAARSSAAAP